MYDCNNCNRSNINIKKKDNTMANRNITEHDRQIDRQNLEKAREAKKEAGSQHRHITEHDRQVDRQNLEKAREAKAKKQADKTW